MRRSIAVLLTAILATFTAFAHSAFAQESRWPNRPIKLIVPTGAGTATDVTARVMANEIGKAISGTVVVENIGGSSGIPAMRAGAQARPDGYTFIFANSSGMSLNAVSFKSLPYDPAKDFDAVALVADLAPIMLSVHKDFPVKTIPELIAYVRANPGKLSYAVDATTGAPVLFGKMFNLHAKTDITAVPYRSSAQMVQDAGAGRVEVLIASIAAARPQVEAGNLRPVALFSSRRFAGAPNLPTVAETLPGTGIDGWFIVVAPTGTPAEPIARVNKAIGDFLARPENMARLHDIGLDMGPPLSPEQTSAYVRDQQASWRKLAAEIGVEPQ